MRAGILASGVAAIVAGAFVLAGASGANAQAKRPAPLELKGEASRQPWKRYPGWPAADYSKYQHARQIGVARRRRKSRAS